MSDDDEVKFLKARLQEKEQAILDLEKKVRLAEFRTKKQVQEVTLQLETERVKLTEAEQRLVNQSVLVNELKEKVQIPNNL
jgi:hypothetical protein